jgi:hypothetical protein
MIFISAAATNSPLSTILLVFIHPFTSTLLVLIIVSTHETAWCLSTHSKYGRYLWPITSWHACCCPVVPEHASAIRNSSQSRRSTCASSVSTAATSTIGSITVPQYIYSTNLLRKPPRRHLAFDGRWSSENVKTDTVQQSSWQHQAIQR